MLITQLIRVYPVIGRRHDDMVVLACHGHDKQTLRREGVYNGQLCELVVTSVDHYRLVEVHSQYVLSGTIFEVVNLSGGETYVELETRVQQLKPCVLLLVYDRTVLICVLIRLEPANNIANSVIKPINTRTPKRVHELPIPRQKQVPVLRRVTHLHKSPILTRQVLYLLHSCPHTVLLHPSHEVKTHKKLLPIIRDRVCVVDELRELPSVHLLETVYFTQYSN